MNEYVYKHCQLSFIPAQTVLILIFIQEKYFIYFYEYNKSVWADREARRSLVFYRRIEAVTVANKFLQKDVNMEL